MVVSSRREGAECSACGRPVPDDTASGAASRVPCPQCGSTKRIVKVHVTDAVEALDGVGLKHWRPSARKGEPIFEGFRGHTERRDPNNPGIVYMERSIDRGAKGSTEKRYRELVVDHRTGEVLRDVDEPLSDHRGRGSAKPGRRGKE